MRDLQDFLIGKFKTYGCPDCIPHWCGLSNSEHKRLAKVRVQAEKQAHQMVVRSREEAALPLAIIKATYDEAERRVRGF